MWLTPESLNMDHPRRHTFVKGLFGQLAPSAARPRRPEDRPRVGFSSARCSTPERREVQEDSRENDQLASTSPGLPCLADIPRVCVNKALLISVIRFLLVWPLVMRIGVARGRYSAIQLKFVNSAAVGC